MPSSKTKQLRLLWEAMADAFKQGDMPRQAGLLKEWQALGGVKSLLEVQDLLTKQQAKKTIKLDQLPALSNPTPVGTAWVPAGSGYMYDPEPITHIPEPIPTTEEIYGYRRWRIELGGEDGPRLSSITARKIWDGPVYQSPEPPRFHESIHRAHGSSTKNRLGIYVNKFESYLDSIEHTNIDAKGQYVDGFVFGIVRMSGIVIEHEQGYRAERAVIDTILLPSRKTARWLFDALGQFYGCEVMTYGDWKAAKDSQSGASDSAEGAHDSAES